MDATIIFVPSSTKNKAKVREPEMRSTRKGKRYYFGMKVHIVADAASGLVNTLVTTAANAQDVTQVHRLPHIEKQQVYSDSDYLGAGKQPENKDNDMEGTLLVWSNKQLQTVAKHSASNYYWLHKQEGQT